MEVSSGACCSLLHYAEVKRREILTETGEVTRTEVKTEKKKTASHNKVRPLCSQGFCSLMPARPQGGRLMRCPSAEPRLIHLSQIYVCISGDELCLIHFLDICHKEQRKHNKTDNINSTRITYTFSVYTK